MEPPLLPGGPPISTTVTTASVVGTMTQPPPPTSSSHLNNYANSLDSASPKSRNSNSWDDQQPANAGGGGKLRLMCSYGGHIIPRPHDKSLCYIGGDSRIFVADRRTSLSDLSSRLSKTLLSGRPFWLKYQLPNEDLDSLISVTTDEDLENMIEEYDRVTKTSRIRVFLFTSEFDSVSSIGSLLESSTKSEDWFVHALNNGGNSGSITTTKVFSESSSVNCLLGLDDDVNCNVKGEKNVKLSAQDVQSVPDSPMVETTSSFGSTNSTPSLANLPPIKVHVEENNQRVGLEEQFSQLGVGVSKVDSSSPLAPAAPVTGAGFSGVPVVVGGDYGSRVFSDDERSEHSVGYRNLSQTQTQQQQQLQQQPPQLQQPKPVVVPSDLPSPNSVSSESSLSGQRHFFYQEPGGQIQSGNNRVSVNSVDPNNRPQVQQQVQDAGYALPVQYDQHQQMYQPQQYVHAGQYIHHTPSGPVPMTSYYPIYPSQQQNHPQHPALDHQYPVYFVQSRPSQAYNLPMQQTNYSESASTMPSNQPQTPSAPNMATPAAAYNHARNPAASKPEMNAGAYRTAATAAPQLVQITSGQHQQQYVGYSQIHHPSQSIAPTSAATANYAYEYSDPTNAQIYYTQSHAPQFAAQYQTIASSPAVGLPNTSSQLPSEKNQATN
nr:PREDICTED: putative mediator of RNA polymerase II transcription subunit 8 [Nicotiana tabacum]